MSSLSVLIVGNVQDFAGGAAEVPEMKGNRVEMTHSGEAAQDHVRDGVAKAGLPW